MASQAPMQFERFKQVWMHYYNLTEPLSLQDHVSLMHDWDLRQLRVLPPAASLNFGPSSRLPLRVAVATPNVAAATSSTASGPPPPVAAATQPVAVATPPIAVTTPIVVAATSSTASGHPPPSVAVATPNVAVATPSAAAGQSTTPAGSSARLPIMKLQDGSYLGPCPRQGQEPLTLPPDKIKEARVSYVKQLAEDHASVDADTVAKAFARPSRPCDNALCGRFHISEDCELMLRCNGCAEVGHVAHDCTKQCTRCYNDRHVSARCTARTYRHGTTVIPTQPAQPQPILRHPAERRRELLPLRRRLALDAKALRDDRVAAATPASITRQMPGESRGRGGFQSFRGRGGSQSVSSTSSGGVPLPRQPAPTPHSSGGVPLPRQPAPTPLAWANVHERIQADDRRRIEESRAANEARGSVEQQRLMTQTYRQVAVEGTERRRVGTSTSTIPMNQNQQSGRGGIPAVAGTYGS
ncbi:MAG: hypothetical protein Q9225_005626 [Loekoesia sp. 1 TL-2023]